MSEVTELQEVFHRSSLSWERCCDLVVSGSLDPTGVFHMRSSCASLTAARPAQLPLSVVDAMSLCDSCAEPPRVVWSFSSLIRASGEQIEAERVARELLATSDAGSVRALCGTLDRFEGAANGWFDDATMALVANARAHGAAVLARLEPAVVRRWAERCLWVSSLTVPPWPSPGSAPSWASSLLSDWAVVDPADPANSQRTVGDLERWWDTLVVPTMTRPVLCLVSAAPESRRWVAHPPLDGLAPPALVALWSDPYKRLCAARSLRRWCGDGDWVAVVPESVAVLFGALAQLCGREAATVEVPDRTEAATELAVLLLGSKVGAKAAAALTVASLH